MYTKEGAYKKSRDNVPNFAVFGLYYSKWCQNYLDGEEGRGYVKLSSTEVLFMILSQHLVTKLHQYLYIMMNKFPNPAIQFVFLMKLLSYGFSHRQ